MIKSEFVVFDTYTSFEGMNIFLSYQSVETAMSSNRLSLLRNDERQVESTNNRQEDWLVLFII